VGSGSWAARSGQDQAGGVNGWLRLALVRFLATWILVVATACSPLRLAGSCLGSLALESRPASGPGR